MLITFKSHASQDLIMMRDLAVTLLGIIGKHLGERGVITIEELPRCIHILEAAVTDAKKMHPAVSSVHPGKNDDDNEEEVSHNCTRNASLVNPYLRMIYHQDDEGVDEEEADAHPIERVRDAVD